MSEEADPDTSGTRSVLTLLVGSVIGGFSDLVINVFSGAVTAYLGDPAFLGTAATGFAVGLLAAAVVAGLLYALLTDEPVLGSGGLIRTLLGGRDASAPPDDEERHRDASEQGAVAAHPVEPCPNCGRENPPGTVFCPACATRIEDAAVEDEPSADAGETAGGDAGAVDSGDTRDFDPDGDADADAAVEGRTHSHPSGGAPSADEGRDTGDGRPGIPTAALVLAVPLGVVGGVFGTVYAVAAGGLGALLGSAYLLRRR